MKFNQTFLKRVLKEKKMIDIKKVCLCFNVILKSN